jgi:alginate O-acetyltransferase complex protein AlgJ
MKRGFLKYSKGVLADVALVALPVALCLQIVFSCKALAQSPARISAKASLAPAVVEGKEGWLFLGTELRFLGVKDFRATGRKKEAEKLVIPGDAGPLAAIVDFDKQLKAAGVHLLLVPVPPKAWGSKCAPAGEWAGLKADSLGAFYREVSAQGVDVLDLRPAFAGEEAKGEAMFCKTDSHWSGLGCVVAAQQVAERVRPFLPAVSPVCQSRWREVSIHGDLEELAQRKNAPGETLRLREVSDMQGNPLSSDPSSPLLLIGDSHTLVFREFLGERAGFADQLALETCWVPEVIGTRGSGANAVRVSMFRRNVKDPRYLAAKKVVVWCFAAREFTEADQGWQSIPLNRSEGQNR